MSGVVIHHETCGVFHSAQCSCRSSKKVLIAAGEASDGVNPPNHIWVGVTVTTLRTPRLGLVRELIETKSGIRARVWFPYKPGVFPTHEQHHALSNLQVCCGPLLAYPP